MSIWTHVNGSIRFDGLRIPGMPNMHPETFLGNTASYEDDQSAWDACDVPCGSEGSLQYTVWENPFENAISAWTATIFGDLRDYENEDEIITYFNGLVAGKMRLIRQAVFSIEVEGRPERVFLYSSELDRFIER